MKKTLIIILGAGASHDCLLSPIPNQVKLMPLTNNLFSPEYLIANRGGPNLKDTYKGALSIGHLYNQRFYRNEISLESFLDEILEKKKKDKKYVTGTDAVPVT